MKSTVFSYCTILICCAFASVAFAQSTYDSHRYLVVFDPGTSQSYIDQVRTDHNSIEIWSSPISNIRYWEVISFPFQLPGDPDYINDINENINEVRPRPNVQGVDLDFDAEVDLDAVPLTPSSGSCVDKDKDLAMASIHTTKVSILDTGLDPTVFSTQYTYMYGNYTGYDYINNDNIPEDSNGHGTHISGIISHTSQHLALQAGVTTDIQFDIRKVFGNDGEGDLSTIIYAFEEAVLNGANIINCSFAYYAEPQAGQTAPFQVAIENAQAYGVLVNAAAGNETSDNDDPNLAAFPASFDSENIISVASHGCNQNLSFFSNYGLSTVDLASLGENVDGPHPVLGVVQKSGTSQATAIVSGVAVALGTHLTNPNYVPIKCAIINGVETAAPVQGYVLTGGLLHAEQANDELGACDNNNGPGGSGSYQSKSEKMNNIAYSLYPNPCHEYLLIDLNESVEESVLVEIYSITGRKFLETHIVPQQSLLIVTQIKELASGPYVAKFNYKGNSKTMKFFKQ